jgi:hypothetical protein
MSNLRYPEPVVQLRHRIDFGYCTYTVTSDLSNNSLVVEYLHFEPVGTDPTSHVNLYLSGKVEAVAVANAILKVAESLD